MIPPYGQIFNFGSRFLDRLFDGPVVVEEKVDGSQFSFGRLNGELCARSKGQAIILEAPDKQFAEAARTVLELPYPLVEGVIFRGEYLSKPKHNALAYARVPAQNIVIFDVTVDGRAASPADRAVLAGGLGFECVPVLAEGQLTPDTDQLERWLQLESCLGGTRIEGVVVKNYNQPAPDGGPLMGKFVSPRFREINTKSHLHRPARGDIVQRLIDRYRTEARWQKAVQHLRDLGQLEREPRDIGKLILEVRADVKLECADEVREALFAHFWPQLERAIVAGLPEWYKGELAKAQLEREGTS